ncbi:MAG: hypothetical protein LBV68_06375 [Spirochaetaceae bacterium]|jgi:uncharacterized membrane protein HdeD (DUF308 family)|nr:hypothetical protein [Spirochaetaceae bacterium]
MLQLYFLSVFCDTAAGIMILRGFGEKKSTDRALQHIDTYRFVLGILTVLTGLLVLINPIDGTTPILGDLFPALAGVLSGLTLIYEYLGKDSTFTFSDAESPVSVPDSDFFRKNNNMIVLVLRANQRTIGYISIIAGILHFLLPSFMFI